MKLTKIVLTAAVLAASVGQANAGHDNGKHRHGGYGPPQTEPAHAAMYPGGETIRVKVNGLVCDFCAQSIKKVFLKTGAVKNTDINLKKGFVKVRLIKGKNLPDTKVKKLLEDSGYATVSISRSEK